jgi:hypothetical protein
MTAANDFAIRRAIVAADVEFIDENGGGLGVRLRNRQGPKRRKLVPHRLLCVTRLTYSFIWYIYILLW